ncbi:hypothetical protein [Paenisporosarcina sp. OV554]|uniref:hypothetical protein n=1 Tax=Paenisporosarcina sp. OV554 TaxID=2135694 RepID=UPI000D3CCF0B|nr:hypothetical protein [Paenisporosarcina sp. OV554]PUB12621.1 hypothetical protein C8K15_109120 [Paenisporosarcina sp. OV554]
MTFYVKSSNSTINVVDAQGKPQRVTQRAYDILYRNQGYQLADAPIVEADDDQVNYFVLSEEKLKTIKNDELKAFLDKEEIEYDPKAIKKDLIKLILRE